MLYVDLNSNCLGKNIWVSLAVKIVKQKSALGRNYAEEDALNKLPDH
jgi:hypothetical protein